MEFETIDYDEKDFLLINTNNSSDIKFDEKIKLKWNQKVEQKLFRYNLNISKSRIVNGKQKYILQLNLERLEERRSPQSLYSMSTPFNPNLFNFNKMDKREILFRFKNKSLTTDEMNLIAINVCPLEYCHILLVPQMDLCLPQVFTMQASSMAVDFLLLTTHTGWKVGFNSLLAMATVNHLHLHAWIIDHVLSIQNKTGLKLSDDLYIVEDEVTRAYAFQLDVSDPQKLKTHVFVVSNYLQQNQIAHNIFWVRDSSFEGQAQTIKAFIWPRKSVFGNKLESDDAILMNVAVAELAGHVPMYVDELFDVLTEDDINARLLQQMLSAPHFASLTQTILRILAGN